ncbi:LapA family protein [Bacteroidota bacterium]
MTTKRIIVLILIVLSLLFIIQNYESVTVYILFFNISMPIALLITITILIGVLIGVILPYEFKKMKKES